MKQKYSYKCINCDASVDELYKIYSPTVSKLTTCERCQQITDKYIEYEPVIIMIDLVLLKKEAFRHFLFNTQFQIFWKIAILLQLMEAYSEWMFSYPKTISITKDDKLTHEELIFRQHDIDFYLICVKVMYRNMVYIGTIYILTIYLTKLGIVPCKIDFTMLAKTFTISSFGKFFLLPALIWSDYLSENLNIINDSQLKDLKLSKKTSSNITIAKSIVQSSGIQFRDEVGILDKIRFRKLYQRKIDPEKEPEVIVLQDVKDVAFFTANVTDLSLELVKFMHTTVADRMLRALIVYFQYYIQIWNKLMYRREEMEYRLTQPRVTEMEHLIRDNLSDLRSMVSIEFGAIVMGASDTQKFHHLANKNGASLSGRDRRIYNLYVKMMLRIVWLALQRPNIALIEMEMTRLGCSDSFNSFVHQGKKVERLQSTLAEDGVLRGTANVKEPRLLQRSPYGKEILIENHDHRMLGMHMVNFPPTDEWLEFLEACFTAPEELLADMNITVGVLGLKRQDFDEMLKKKEDPKKKKKEGDSYVSFQELEEEEEELEPGFELTFIIPNKIIHSDDKIPVAFPQEPPKYSRSPKTTAMIRQQCEMWKQIVRNALVGIKSPSLSNYST